MELFTGIALVLTFCSAVAALTFALHAWKSSERAGEHVASLRQMRGQLAAVELQANALQVAHKRLEGRVHAAKRRRPAPGEHDDDDDENDDEPGPVDPELAAALALQSASPGRPNGSR